MIRKLFNNRAFIIGLAVCSGLLVLHSLATPFLDEPDFSEVEAPIFDPDQEAHAELEVVARDEVAVSDTDSIWRAEQSVLSGQLTWNSHPRRDPFSGSTATLVVMPAADPDVGVRIGVPRLDALVAGPDSLFAVLNDQIVREGDLIAGYQVTRITRDGVRVASSYQSHWLAVADMEIETETEAETSADDAAFAGPPDLPAALTDGPEPGG